MFVVLFLSVVIGHNHALYKYMLIEVHVFYCTKLILRNEINTSLVEVSNTWCLFIHFTYMYVQLYDHLIHIHIHKC